MENDEIADIVKKVIEVKEKEKQEKQELGKEVEKIPTPNEIPMNQEGFDDQKIEAIIDKKVAERVSMELKNIEEKEDDKLARRQGAWSLTLGILSVLLSTSLVFSIVSSIFAIILSRKAKNRVKHLKTATAGFVLGVIGISLTAFIYFWVIMAFLANEIF